MEAIGELLESRNVEVCRAAVALAGAVADPALAPALLALFEEESLREAVAHALVHMGGKAALALLPAWEDADSLSRACISYVAGETGCVEALEKLQQGVGSTEETVQLAAAEALGKLDDVRAIPPLVECLRESGEEVRTTVLGALSRLGQRHREPVVDALSPLLEAEEPDLRMCAVAVLGRLDGPEVQRTLAFALKDESALVRQAAVRSLEARPGEELLQHLMLALTDEDAEVRRLAAETLGRSGDRQALTALELALQDDDTWVRSTAVQALGQLGGERAVQLSRQALHDPIGLVSISALETLAAIDPEGALPVFVEALAHEDEEVVNAALGMLCRLGSDQQWLPAVQERLLNDPRWEVRIHFVRTLAELQGPECRAALEQRLLIEGEALVRDQIREILSRIGDSQQG